MSEAASSAGTLAFVVAATAFGDDFFHNELRLRHIGRRRVRHDDDKEVEQEELFAETGTGDS